MVDQLTKKQAFECMKCFLEKHYLRTGSDDIGSLLGDLQFLDGDPADLASWNDWLRCINSIVGNNNSPND